MSHSDSVQATVYLQLQPEYHHFLGRDTAAGIVGAKVVGSTQNRAQKPKPGTVEVKLTVELPKGAFLPLRPEAVVVIPETLTQPHPITVEALDPTEQDNQA